MIKNNNFKLYNLNNTLTNDYRIYNKSNYLFMLEISKLAKECLDDTLICKTHTMLCVARVPQVLLPM